jgi:hypothetical protein
MTSTVTATLNGTRADVWSVLADGWLYGLWVVGASRIRQVDETWPEIGARIHHSVGTWPLVLDDTTQVVSCEPERKLALQARAWPSGEAFVEIGIEETAEGCVVTIVEDASHGPARLIPGVVRRSVLGWRNTESLKRLGYLVEHRAARERQS